MFIKGGVRDPTINRQIAGACVWHFLWTDLHEIFWECSQYQAIHASNFFKRSSNSRARGMRIKYKLARNDNDYVLKFR